MCSYRASAHFCALTSGSTDDQRGIPSPLRDAFQILLPDKDRSANRASGFPVLGGARHRDVSAGLALGISGSSHMPDLQPLKREYKNSGRKSPIASRTTKARRKSLH